MIKRSLDVAISLILIVALAPILGLFALLIFLYDWHSPFYVAPRVGKDGRIFRMVKFRSMETDADRKGGASTSSTDRRITPIGRFIRAYKLDELTQLWNVLRGHMSLVGPRPNVPVGVAVYTAEERDLLDVKPGITDFASIVFSDEGEILRGHENPDMAYDRLIRPWKSRLGLFYIAHRDIRLDFRLMWLTAVAVLSRRLALVECSKELARRGAPHDLVRMALRCDDLDSLVACGSEH